MFKKILFAIDIDDKNSWNMIIPKVIEFCKLIPECELVIINVIPTYSLGIMEEYFPKNWAAEVSKKAKAKLEEIVHKNLPEDLKTKLVIKKGAVYQAIISHAEDIEADLIIMSAHHPKRSDYLLGPNTAKVVRHSSISVMVIRD